MIPSSADSCFLFLFCGQGSQYFQMGADLMARDRHFRAAMEQLDAVAHRALGSSVIARVFDPRRKSSELFVDTPFTHPANFMVGHAMVHCLEMRGIRPAAVLGSSLGEYVAAVSAGVMELGAAFEIVLRQAQLFDAVCPAGGMLAVLNSATLYTATPFLYRRSELVSEYYNRHFVISVRTTAALREIEGYLAEHGIGFQTLAVARAFHSSAMEPAADGFFAILSPFGFDRPHLPFFSTVTGRLQTHFDAGYFWNLVRRKILFREALYEAERQGPWLYLDAGPSGTMATLGRNILGPHTSSEFFPLLSPFGSIDRCLHHVQIRHREALTAAGGAS